MVRAGRLGEAEDLGAEVVHRAAGETAGPAAGQAARRGHRGRVPGGHQPGVAVRVAVAELTVRDDHWLAGRVERGHGGVETGVRAVDHDAQPVALGHHVPAEPAQAAVHRRLGLHVAELIDPVMNQGEHGDPVRAGFLEPAQVTLEEVAALAAEQHHGAPVPGGPFQVGRRGGYPGAGLGRGRPDPVQLAAVVGVRLPGAEVTVRAQPLRPVRPQHREVGHGRQVHRGHARGPGGPQRVRDRRRAQRGAPGRQPGQEAPSGVPVQIDPRFAHAGHHAVLAYR